MNPPSPDRTSYLNRMHELGMDFEVIYVPIGPDDHGWGDLELRHPHRLASRRLEATTAAVEAICTGRANLLVSYGYRTLPFAAALTAARMKGVPTVVRSDTNIDAIRAEPVWKRLARRSVARALVPRGTVAWTIGSKNSEFWRVEVGLRREVRIPYEVSDLPGGGVATVRTREPSDTLKILYVGRLIPVKRVQDLVAAALSLPDSLSWELRVVGDGPERSRLESLAEGDRRITFAGAVEYVRLGKFFAESDVFVLPSSFEPWGLVVNEALGYGLYVIATEAVGAAHDLIAEGVNGRIVAAGDVRGLTSALMDSSLVACRRPTPPQTDTSRLMMEAIQSLTGSD
jgi:glycosyltransferase involved in cell wall biosynthesis